MLNWFNSITRPACIPLVKVDHFVTTSLTVVKKSLQLITTLVRYKRVPYITPVLKFIEGHFMAKNLLGVMFIVTALFDVRNN